MLSSGLDTSCLQRLGATWVTAVPSTKSKVIRLQRGSTGPGQSMYANWDGFWQNRFQEALRGDISKGDFAMNGWPAQMDQNEPHQAKMDQNQC